MRHVKSALWTIVSVIVIYAALWWFFGTTTVDATLDGKPLEGAIVKIDGKKVGKTPFSDRLGPGFFSILVIPPKRVTAKESYSEFVMATVVLGKECNAEFHSPDDVPEE